MRARFGHPTNIRVNMRDRFLLTAFMAAFVVAALTSTLAQQVNPPASATAAPDYSGMYAFLRDGEFVQITVEDQGHVTGFISRYGERESDRGAFLEHFFKTGSLDGNKLTFVTNTVHGVWFEFRGTIEPGENRKADEEGYYLLKGTLIQSETDESKKTTSRSREVALKSFPRDLPENETKK